MKFVNLLVTSLLVITCFSCDSNKNLDDKTLKTKNTGKVNDEVSMLLNVLENDSKDGQIKMEAIARLGIIGDKRAVEPLIELLRKDMKKRTGLWANAIGALGELGDSRATPVLTEALNKREDDWLGREMAARALGSIGDADAVESLLSASYFVETRDSAIWALAEIADARAIEILISALDEAENQDTVQAAMEGLIKIGRPAVSALSKELKNYSNEYPNQYRREKVEQILKVIKE